MAEFTVEARRYLEEHGFDYGGLVPEKLSQRVKVTTTSKEFFRISIRNCEYKTTMKFPKVCKAWVRGSVLYWEGPRPLLPGKCLCEMDWNSKVSNECRFKLLKMLIDTKQPPTNVSRFILSQYKGEIVTMDVPRMSCVQILKCYQKSVENEWLDKFLDRLVELNAHKRTGSICLLNDGGENAIEEAFNMSKMWWGTENVEDCMELCWHSSDCTKVDLRGHKTFDTLTTMEDRARFAASQIVRFNLRNSKQCIDYAAVVSDHFLMAELPIFRPLVDHILDQLKRKIQKKFPKDLNLKDVYKNSQQYWKESGEKSGTLLCELPRNASIDKFCMELFGTLVNEDTKARFAASQMIGYPVTSWLRLVDPNFLFPLDVSLIPGNRKLKKGSQLEETMFRVVKRILGISTCPRHPDVTSLLQSTFGVEEAKRCFHIGDLGAPSYGESEIILPKPASAGMLFVEKLFHENIRSTVFFFIIAFVYLQVAWYGNCLFYLTIERRNFGGRQNFEQTVHMCVHF